MPSGALAGARGMAGRVRLLLDAFIRLEPIYGRPGKFYDPRELELYKNCAKIRGAEYAALWIPDHLVHDCEPDDLLVWLLLIHVHRHFGTPLRTLIQLPSGERVEKVRRLGAAGAGSGRQLARARRRDAPLSRVAVAGAGAARARERPGQAGALRRRVRDRARRERAQRGGGARRVWPQVTRGYAWRPRRRDARAGELRRLAIQPSRGRDAAAAAAERPAAAGAGPGLTADVCGPMIRSAERTTKY